MALFTGQLVVAQMLDGPSFQNQDKLQGRVALIKNDDTALLVETALAAQNAGAIGVVHMMNYGATRPGADETTPSTGVHIPVLLVSSNDEDCYGEQSHVCFAGK